MKMSSLPGRHKLNSIMTEFPIHLQDKSMDWFLYDRNLRYKKVNVFKMMLEVPCQYVKVCQLY